MKEEFELLEDSEFGILNLHDIIVIGVVKEDQNSVSFCVWLKSNTYLNSYYTFQPRDEYSDKKYQIDSMKKRRETIVDKWKKAKGYDNRKV